MSQSSTPHRILKIHSRDPMHIWLRDFNIDLQAANRTQGTIEFYNNKLHPFLSHLAGQGVIQPEQIKPTHIRSFLVELATTHNEGGVHAHWRALRAFIRFLVREEAIEKNPLNKVRTPKVDEQILEPITIHEVNALLRTCDGSDIGLRDKAIILTLLDTGLRAGELLRLNIGDVNLIDGTVTVRKSKNHKPRVSFVGKKSRKALSTYLRRRPEQRPADPLFITYHTIDNRDRLQYGGLRDIILRRAEWAGLEKAPNLHSFRRGFAITMLRNGTDLVSLSRMMGHGSLAVLTKYLKQITEDLGGLHAQNSPVDTNL